jgi:hypothetical protein
MQMACCYYIHTYTHIHTYTYTHRHGKRINKKIGTIALNADGMLLLHTCINIHTHTHIHIYIQAW